LVLWTSARRDWLGLGVAALLGFCSEIHGVKYGVIFSPYNYTEVLQPQLFGVPLVMFSAWLVLLAYTRQMTMPLRLPRWLNLVTTSAWMTAIDLVIDPLAAHQLGYWRWARAGAYYGIPLQNFVGWFVVSLLIFALVRQRWQPNRWAQVIGLSVTVFFTVLALRFGLWLPAGVGLALCGMHAALAVGAGSAGGRFRCEKIG
jgi:putative membrane protein